MAFSASFPCPARSRARCAMPAWRWLARNHSSSAGWFQQPSDNVSARTHGARHARATPKGIAHQKPIRIAVIALAVASAALGCTAQADQATDKLKATLQTRLGDVDIKSVSKAPIAGLYEVNLGSQIIYSDANGDYVLLGDLVDTKKRANLTEARLAETNKIDFASLPLANAVKVVKGADR